METGPKDLLKQKRPESELLISTENGFIPLITEAVNAKVFVKDKKVFKLTERNSLNRQALDLEILRKRMVGYEGHLSSSEIIECLYEGKIYTCVIQPFIEGLEVKKMQKDKIEAAFRVNKDFLLELLKYFFEAIESKSLYPDIVGYPKDPEYFNSINLILEEATNKVILCDVGLSPHEDTLAKHGEDFYDSENVKTYIAKMKKFKEFLLTL